MCSIQSPASSGGLNKNFQLFIKVINFSNEDLHHPGFCSAAQTKSCYSDDESYSFEIYSNGKCDEFKDYVSVVIIRNCSLKYYIRFSMSCVISVVDVHGNQRYSHSLAVSYDRPGHDEEIFNRFVARKTLLSEQSDLLPEDILTLCVDFYFSESIFGTFYNDPVANNIFVYDPCENIDDMINISGKKCVVDLDSVIFQTLAEHSEYFKRLLHTPMQEKATGNIQIEYSEYMYLKYICMLLIGQYYDSFYIEGLCAWYKVADQYLIDTASDMLREGLIHILCTDTFEMISEVAELCEDDYLKKILKEFEGGTFYREKDYIEYYSYSITRVTEDEEIVIYFQVVKQEKHDVCPAFDFYK